MKIKVAMNDILIGAIAMASLIVALFFLRFWRSTRDRFFLYFALSFFIEGFNRIVLSPASAPADEVQDFVYYVLRLVAYGLILVAVWEKNRPVRKGTERRE
jgi:hypothetical protein